MRLLIAFILLIALASPVCAGEASYYIGSRSGTDLLAQPDTRADVVRHLDWKTYVVILESSRNWRKVKIADDENITGWVTEGAIRKRFQSTSSKSSSSFFSGFTSLFRSPEPEQKTAVLGVRGLEDDANAKSNVPSTAEAKEMVKWMDTLAVPNRDVARFIEDGELNP